MGPKPFSTEAAEISFDKVFAVPNYPNANKVNDLENHDTAVEEEEEAEDLTDKPTLDDVSPKHEAKVKIYSNFHCF